MSTLQEWTWTGTCQTGCVGTATMHVQMPGDYVPGTPLFTPTDTALILQALYTDSNGSSDLAAQPFPAAPLAAVVIPGQVLTVTEDITTVPDGRWQFESRLTTFGPCNSALECYVARGVGSQWTDPVTVASEASTGLFVGTALILAWLWRRWA